MKKLKKFSSALAMLISFLSFGQENLNKMVIQNETPKIIFKKQSLQNDPLYVIDGMISSDSILKTIKPENIKNINVLKGNGATAIYGQKAQNGVIIIETKDPTKKQLRKIKKNSEKAVKNEEI